MRLVIGEDEVLTVVFLGPRCRRGYATLHLHSFFNGEHIITH